MRQHLRRSLVYQNALRTGSIMTETPANSILALRSRRYEHMHDDLWIYSAGKKLDHLIREALDPMIRCIRPYEPPAIMVFLNEFDRTFLKMRITDEAREWIESRIAFCREMIGVAKQECEAYAWLPHHLIRNYMRDRSVVRTTHPDWEFLSTSRMTGADAWMQNLGRGSGEIKTLDNLSKMPQPGCHWFIKELRPDTLQRLKRVNWREVAYPPSPPRAFIRARWWTPISPSMATQRLPTTTPNMSPR